MDVVQKKKIGLTVVILAIALIVPLFVTKPYYLHVITMCLLWAFLASSWNIFCGFAGQLSLGHGIFTAIGAYVTVILFNEFGISPWIGMFYPDSNPANVTRQFLLMQNKYFASSTNPGKLS
jgi:ABC-type branched-subunit amino acid transport system permease subunit